MTQGETPKGKSNDPKDCKRNKLSQLIASESSDHDAGGMSSTNITINNLLEEALNEPDIGTTSRFRWHATAVGIAALWTDNSPPPTPPFEDALREGLNLGLDLSREEREFHQVKDGLVLLFHS